MRQHLREDSLERLALARCDRVRPKVKKLGLRREAVAEAAHGRRRGVFRLPIYHLLHGVPGALPQ